MVGLRLDVRTPQFSSEQGWRRWRWQTSQGLLLVTTQRQRRNKMVGCLEIMPPSSWAWDHWVPCQACPRLCQLGSESFFPCLKQWRQAGSILSSGKKLSPPLPWLQRCRTQLSSSTKLLEEVSNSLLSLVAVVELVHMAKWGLGFVRPSPDDRRTHSGSPKNVIAIGHQWM